MILIRRPTSPTLFPYTTLFRSDVAPEHHRPQEGEPAHQHPQDRADDHLAAQHPQQVAEVDLADAHRRSEEHTSELQSPCNLVCRLLLENKKTIDSTKTSHY